MIAIAERYVQIKLIHSKPKLVSTNNTDKNGLLQTLVQIYLPLMFLKKIIVMPPSGLKWHNQIYLLNEKSNPINFGGVFVSNLFTLMGIIGR